MKTKCVDWRYTAGLSFGALGVVYGDIGTSPLYALRECFSKEHGLIVTPENVLGVLSLIFWSLIMLVCVKYIGLVMQAGNRGEGGILALMSLAVPERRLKGNHKGRWILAGCGVFGAALLYGDGIITPAVSILGAIEGLNVATASFEPYIIPTTIVILVLLFSVQRFGTGHVGRVFGFVMLGWFITIALLGIRATIQHPEVLSAFNPSHGLSFLLHHGHTGFLVLGSVFLCVTGGEALYADMGHFGVRPIRWAWFGVALPALLLNYLGQGALLLADPSAAENPFYLLAPKPMLIPLVILATAAAVIASQALISGAFSLTMQAIQLGYSPRMEIDHTSSNERGQIYMPRVNWMLMLGCIALVLMFRNSSNLAAAYGIAVTLTMMITTVLFYVVACRLWKWSPWVTMPVCGLFLLIEGAFFGANLVKVAHGGWVPLVVGATIFTFMSTWKTGRRMLGDRLRASSLPLDIFLTDVKNSKPTRVPGVAIFMAGNAEGTPLALLHNLKHNKVLHQRVVILNITTEEQPHVDDAERVEVEELTDGFFRVRGYYGFMEEPDVMNLLAHCRVKGLNVNAEQSTFFLSRETIIPTRGKGMMMWREHLFAIMSRNAYRATSYFRLPANRVVELGMQVEI